MSPRRHRAVKNRMKRRQNLTGKPKLNGRFPIAEKWLKTNGVAGSGKRAEGDEKSERGQPR